MKRMLTVVLLAALACSMLNVAVAEENEDDGKLDLYLQLPLLAKPDWAFPTVTEREDGVVISGLSALGVHPEDMTAYRCIFGEWFPVDATGMDIPEDSLLLIDFQRGIYEGGLYVYLSGDAPLENITVGFDDSIFDEYDFSQTNTAALQKALCCWLESAEAEAADGVKSAEEVSVELKMGDIHVKSSNDQFICRADYDEEGWLIQAEIHRWDVGFPNYTYTRTSALSRNYAMDYIFVDQQTFSRDAGQTWYSREIGGNVEAPEGFDPNDWPFRVIGGENPGQEGGLRGAENEAFPSLSDDAVVYGTYPAGNNVPLLPEVEASDGENGNLRLTVRGVKAWGVRAEDMRVWIRDDQAEWAPGGDPLGEDMLILETPDRDDVRFRLKGEEDSLDFSLDYEPGNQYMEVSARNHGTRYTRNSNIQILVEYSVTDDEDIRFDIMAIYSNDGDLMEYTVIADGENYSYTYTCEPFRLVNMNEPLLMFVNLYDDETGRSTGRYYYQKSVGWSVWNDETGGWEAGEAPANVERYVPLPIQ